MASTAMAGIVPSPSSMKRPAAWVKMMPCHEIAGEIQSHIDFLTSTSRNVSERHRSVRACFEYSWALLSPKEREVLSRLSVFHGGFTREAAAEVAGGSLPVLMSLLDKSLLQVEGGRYENHPLLRRYAGEKLSEQPQVQEDAETRHGQYYLRYLDGCNGQEDVLGKLDLERFVPFHVHGQVVLVAGVEVGKHDGAGDESAIRRRELAFVHVP